MTAHELSQVADAMVRPGKGIIAIDESISTCNKRFEQVGIAPEPAQRRAYRELLLTTPRLGEWISGAILYDETMRQGDGTGRQFVDILNERGILPGIKVDIGTVPMPGCAGETITEGLDGLPKRVEEYRRLGARFAKWRAVLTIGDRKPSDRAVEVNAYALGRYARICQDGGLVPIVEPEVLTEGAHTVDRCYEVTRRVLTSVFEALAFSDVDLRAIVLKPNMVTQGSECPMVTDIPSVAKYTVEVLSMTVPPAVAGIAFLSGGQDDILATRHLQAMNRLPARFRPWPLTFSYGRAIQQAAMAAWAGSAENVARAQEIVAQRSQCNAAASTGSFSEAPERPLYTVAVQ